MEKIASTKYLPVGGYIDGSLEMTLKEGQVANCLVNTVEQWREEAEKVYIL